MAFYLEEETDVVFEISVVSVFLNRFFLSVWIILLSYSNFKRRESHRVCYPGRNNEHFGSNRCFSSQATTCESHSSKTGDETELDNYWQISFLSVLSTVRNTDVSGNASHSLSKKSEVLFKKAFGF